MKNFVLSLGAIGLLSIVSVGCNKGPDPKANPNFQEKTLMEPGAVKMGAEAPKPAQSN